MTAHLFCPQEYCVLVTIFTAFRIPGFSATAQTLTLIPMIVPTWLHSVKCSHMDSVISEPIISLLLRSPVLYQHLLLFPGLQKAEYHSASQRYACPILQDIPRCFSNYSVLWILWNAVGMWVFWTSSSMVTSLGFLIPPSTVFHGSSSIST